MTAHEFAALAAQSRDQLAARSAAERAKTEAARFYNLPSANADYGFWCKVDYWTADEAAALLLGRDPRVVNPEALAVELKKPTGLLSLAKAPAPAEFHLQYDGLRTLLQRSSDLQGNDLTPRATVQWAARTKAVIVPPALAAALDRTADSQTPQAAAAVSAKGASAASGGTQTRWTPEMLEKLREYRKQHGTKAAAQEFGISDARVRSLLPGNHDKSTISSLFSGFTHRIK